MTSIPQPKENVGVSYSKERTVERMHSRQGEEHVQRPENERGKWPDQGITHSSICLETLLGKKGEVEVTGKGGKRTKWMKENNETRGRTGYYSPITKGLICHTRSLFILVTMGNH